MKKLGKVIFSFLVLSFIYIQNSSAACGNTKVETVTTAADGSKVKEVTYLESETPCRTVDQKLALANQALKSAKIKGYKISYSKLVNHLNSEYSKNVPTVENIYLGPNMEGRDGVFRIGYSSDISFDYSYKGLIDIQKVSCEINIFKFDSFTKVFIKNCNVFVTLIGDCFPFDDLEFNLDKIADQVSTSKAIQEFQAQKKARTK
jgi:hypothetical protein